MFSSPRCKRFLSGNEFRRHKGNEKYSNIEIEGFRHIVETGDCHDKLIDTVTKKTFLQGLELIQKRFCFRRKS